MTDSTSAGSSKNRVHELKTWPEFFARIEDGTKTFELRKDDRGFRAGDTLVLREWNPRMETYTGNELRRVVTYLMCGPPFGLMKDWVAMGLAPETDAGTAAGLTMALAISEAEDLLECAQPADNLESATDDDWYEQRRQWMLRNTFRPHELKARARPCGDGCPGCDYCRSPSDSPPENGNPQS